jgi:hypothetical protein
MSGVSNTASIGENENAANKSIKKNKRLVTNDHVFHWLKQLLSLKLIPISLQVYTFNFIKNF